MNERKVKIEPLQLRTIILKIKGLSSLIMGKFDVEKYREEQIDKRGSVQRKKKDYEKEFKASLHPMINGKYTFPARAVTKAMTLAAHTFAKMIKRTEAKGIQIAGGIEYLEIISKSGPKMRIDPVTNANGRPDIRVRAEFDDWEMSVPIECGENGPLSEDHIINLATHAGYYIGLGQWRPGSPKGGNHGMFTVIEAKIEEMKI